jgi:hypothetical protein
MDGQTDMMKQMVASRNFTNASQKIPQGYYITCKILAKCLIKFGDEFNFYLSKF